MDLKADIKLAFFSIFATSLIFFISIVLVGVTDAVVVMPASHSTTHYDVSPVSQGITVSDLQISQPVQENDVYILNSVPYLSYEGTPYLTVIYYSPFKNKISYEMLSFTQSSDYYSGKFRVGSKMTRVPQFLNDDIGEWS